jgi:lipoyl(octanoyl) transferase
MRQRPPASPASQDRKTGSMEPQDKAYCLDLGLIDYAAAHALQLKIVEARKNGFLNHDVFLILEHAPVFTLGLRGGNNNLKVPESFLASQNIPLVHIERGGDITYHGPGQLIIYPIVHLATGRWRVVSFVEVLEEIMIRIAWDWEIHAERGSVNRGVWAGQHKLGSVGIAVRRSISFHGLALNVNTDLGPFRWINPCGLAGVAVTSLQELKNREIPLPAIRERAQVHIKTLFNKNLEMISLAELEKLLHSKYQGPL